MRQRPTKRFWLAGVLAVALGGTALAQAPKGPAAPAAPAANIEQPSRIDDV